MKTNNTEIMRYIEIDRRSRNALREEFGATKMGTWRALHYQSDSDRAVRMRERAIKRYGGEIKVRLTVPEGFVPNCQTQFIRDFEGKVSAVLQTFANDVTVYMDVTDSTATVSRGMDDVVAEYKGVTMKRWSEILWEAQGLSDELKN